jgi:hypothetical protein
MLSTYALERLSLERRLLAVSTRPVEGEGDTKASSSCAASNVVIILRASFSTGVGGIKVWSLSGEGEGSEPGTTTIVVSSDTRVKEEVVTFIGDGGSDESGVTSDKESAAAPKEQFETGDGILILWCRG